MKFSHQNTKPPDQQKAKNTSDMNLKRMNWIARIGQIAVLLALIRCLIECFPFKFTLPGTRCYENMWPYLTGSLVCGVSTLVMLCLSWFNFQKIIIAVSIITIGMLVYLKINYL
jgi:hypothetical protein